MVVDFLKHAYILLSHGPVISTMQKIWTQSGNLIINVDAIDKNRVFFPTIFFLTAPTKQKIFHYVLVTRTHSGQANVTVAFIRPTYPQPVCRSCMWKT